MTTCPRCDETWTGHRVEHCSADGCHQTFTGTRAGDMHRVGDPAVRSGPKRRRCLTPAEMMAKGMVRSEQGRWTTGRVVPDAIRARWGAIRDDGETSLCQGLSQGVEE